VNEYWQVAMHNRAPKDRAFLAYSKKIGGWVVVDPRGRRNEVSYGATRPQNHRVGLFDVLAIDELPGIPESAR
jgi:hypothetical protein